MFAMLAGPVFFATKTLTSVLLVTVLTKSHARTRLEITTAHVSLDTPIEIAQRILMTVPHHYYHGVKMMGHVETWYVLIDFAIKQTRNKISTLLLIYVQGDCVICQEGRDILVKEHFLRDQLGMLQPPL